MLQCVAMSNGVSWRHTYVSVANMPGTRIENINITVDITDRTEILSRNQRSRDVTVRRQAEGNTHTIQASGIYETRAERVQYKAKNDQAQ